MVEEADLAPLSSRPSSAVLAILGMLNERGLLSFRFSKWPWRADLKKSGIYGENWLPFYEAVRRKWTTDKKMISAVNAGPILSKLLAAKVTFLEDRIFDAARIDISKRVFGKGHPEDRGSRKRDRKGSVNSAEIEDASEWAPMEVSELDYH